MPSVLTEARSQCPELTGAIKAFDKIAYSRNYSEVFTDFTDWLIWQHRLEQTDDNPLSEYTEEEQTYFLDAFKNLQSEVRKRVSLWTKEIGKSNNGEWYDGLGRLYECITSKNKSSMLGQYFTPESVVNLMVQITNPGNNGKQFERVFDPACGSGRMGLSAATNAMSNQTAVWVTMNDIDPICTKMTAVNMCLNGIVGEAICMNGLDIKGDSYRFGYLVSPAYAIYPEETREFYRMLVLMKTGQDIKKQYVLTPLPYEKTYLKQVNDSFLHRMKEAQELKEESEKQQEIENIQQEIKSRMAGTLFEDDTTQLENIKPVSKNTAKAKRKKKGGNSNDQSTLF